MFLFHVTVHAIQLSWDYKTLMANEMCGDPIPQQFIPLICVLSTGDWMNEEGSVACCAALVGSL